MNLGIKIQYKPLRVGHPLPKYGSEGAACADVYASLPPETGGHITLTPGQGAIIKLGFAVAMPPGWELQVRSRSGMAANGLIIANSPGCVDEDYRGEVGAIVRNVGQSAYTITDGMRIAQIAPAMVTKMDFTVTDSLDDTKRGDKGFGSSGV